MNYIYLWLCMVFFLSCSNLLPDAEKAEGEIEIFPDYKEVAIPCNIAPLNFKLKEPCKAIALLSGKDRQEVRVDSDNGSFQIPEKKWRRLLDASAGGNLSVGIYICKDGKWFRYPPFSIRVVKDEIDPYLVYRRIAPEQRRLFLENGKARFIVRRLNVDRHSPAEARYEPLLDVGYFVYWLVAGKHYLPAGIKEFVECVEELLLASFLAGKELHVVY